MTESTTCCFVPVVYKENPEDYHIKSSFCPECEQWCDVTDAEVSIPTVRALLETIKASTVHTGFDEDTDRDTYEIDPKFFVKAIESLLARLEKYQQ